MTAPKITLQIDRIIADQPGIGRAEVARALHREISALVAEGGIAALGQSAYLADRAAPVASGKAPLAGRVAAATVKAVTS